MRISFKGGEYTVDSGSVEEVLEKWEAVVEGDGERCGECGKGVGRWRVLVKGKGEVKEGGVVRDGERVMVVEKARCGKCAGENRGEWRDGGEVFRKLERKAQRKEVKYEGFQAVQELPGFEDAERAREILEELRNDPGFATVMEKHNWKVGVLAEMYPKGKVGVDPVCVLGFNVNQGSRIELRLRTDDLQGFRKMGTIRNVLCHELAHNVHSDHNDDFYQLMRQIEKEVEEFNWTKSPYRTLGSHYVSTKGDHPLLFKLEQRRKAEDKDK